MRAYFRSVRSGKRKAALAGLGSVSRQMMEATLDRQVKPALVKAHEMVVADWEHKPEFQARKVIAPDSIRVYVFPAGENAKIWTFVDQGTEPHVIRPVRAKVLSFRTGYVPKTLARPARTVVGGGKATGEQVFAQVVHHPGNEGRHFSEQIAAEMEPSVTKAVEDTFRNVARAMEE